MTFLEIIATAALTTGGIVSGFATLLFILFTIGLMIELGETNNRRKFLFALVGFLVSIFITIAIGLALFA